VNGDGYGDFIQANGNSYNLLFLGAPNLASPVAIDTSPNIIKLYSSNTIIGSGGVYGIGDFNKDNYDDLLLAAQSDVFLVLGNPAWSGTVDLGSLSNTEIVDYSTGAFTGIAGARAGDFDNDGYKDFLVGSPGQFSNAGATYVVYGRSDASGTVAVSSLQAATDGVIFSEATDTGLGTYVGPAGDVNNDGFDDILAGSDAAVYLIYGGPRSRFTNPMNLGDLNPDHVVKILLDFYATALSAAGDVNNDGFDDIVLNDGGNNILLVYGGASLPNVYNLTGGAFSASQACHIYSSTDVWGTGTLTGGDVTGDGFSDIFIGSYFYGPLEQGRALLIYGGASLPASIDLDADSSYYTFINGSLTYEGLGTGVAINDFNGDGASDLFLDNAIGGSFLIYGELPSPTTTPSSTAFPSSTASPSSIALPSSTASPSSAASASVDIASNSPSSRPLEASNNPRRTTPTPKRKEKKKSHTPRPSATPTAEGGAILTSRSLTAFVAIALLMFIALGY